MSLSSLQRLSIYVQGETLWVHGADCITKRNFHLLLFPLLLLWSLETFEPTPGPCYTSVAGLRERLGALLVQLTGEA